MTEPAQPAGWLTAEQAAQMVADALSQHAASAASAGSVSADQVQAIVDQALARQAEAHHAEMQGLVDSLRGQVVTFVPEHSGGPGLSIAPTWSQYEQTNARAAAEAAKQAAA